MAPTHVCSDKKTGSGLLRLLYPSVLHTLLYRLTLTRACASVPLLRLSITEARQLPAGLAHLHCHYRGITATREREAVGRRENVTREKDYILLHHMHQISDISMVLLKRTLHTPSCRLGIDL
jgi:hypothetical protein